MLIFVSMNAHNLHHGFSLVAIHQKVDTTLFVEIVQLLLYCLIFSHELSYLVVSRLCSCPHIHLALLGWNNRL